MGRDGICDEMRYDGMDRKLWYSNIRAGCTGYIQFEEQRFIHNNNKN